MQTKYKAEHFKITKTDWFKETESKTTPAESLKLLRTTFGYTQQQLAMAHRLADALGTSYRNLFW